ncbi:Os12g0248100 [Oryza sativa Japonica Group]|uniref:Os12g0248100 protein n=1 Tax=Oryza sativa subsp. japonica TaxID=39947 RepID=A0A0P0Y8M6_ORYSJ|nr:Os12g0248100 [Oryza sativa Japonica Group]
MRGWGARAGGRRPSLKLAIMSRCMRSSRGAGASPPASPASTSDEGSGAAHIQSWPHPLRLSLPPPHEGRASSSSEGLIIDHSLTLLPLLSSHWCRASSSSKGLSDCLPIPLLSPASLHECRRARARRGSLGTSLARNLGELELRWCCNGWRKAWRAW